MKSNLDVFLEKTDLVSSILKEISHPVRLRMLCLLIKNKKASVEEIKDFVQISQPQTSQFLKQLKEKNLIDYERNKNTYFYFIKDEKIKILIKNLNKLYCE